MVTSTLERLHPLVLTLLYSPAHPRGEGTGRVRGALERRQLGMCVSSVHSMCHPFTPCGYFPGNDHRHLSSVFPLQSCSLFGYCCRCSGIELVCLIPDCRFIIENTLRRGGGPGAVTFSESNSEKVSDRNRGWRGAGARRVSVCRARAPR